MNFQHYSFSHNPKKNKGMLIHFNNNFSFFFSSFKFNFNPNVREHDIIDLISQNYK